MKSPKPCQSRTLTWTWRRQHMDMAGHRPHSSLTVLVLLASSAARPSIGLAEWMALRQLFNDTGGAAGNWANATGWDVGDYDSAPDPCDGRSWFGIYDWRNYKRFGRDVLACDANAAAGAPRVQVLSLTKDPSAADPAGNGLRGGLGTGFGRLSALRLVLVAGNPLLTGTVPDLAALTALQVLDIYNNMLTGTVPDLVTLTALEQVALYNNALTGTVPALATLTALQQLFLNSNALTGTIPDLAALTALQVLTLYNNMLTGTVPDLATLTSLKQLGVYNNALTGTVPDLAALTALQSLGLSSNALTGTVPALVTLSALQGLGLNSNALIGTVPDLTTLTVLQVLDLTNNTLTGSISSLAALTALQYLGLHNNALTGTVPDLAALTALRTLSLYKNSLTGTIPPLLHLTALRQLLLHANQLCGVVPSLPQRVIAGAPDSGDDDEYQDNLHWAINTDPALTLFDNRLSCALPGAETAPGAGLVAVVAFGNRFSAPASRWVHGETRDAAFLFVPQDAPWRWFVGYLGGGALLLGATVYWAHRAQQKFDPQHPGRSGAEAHPSAATAGAARTFVALQRDGAVALVALACLACGTLLPVYASGARYYECGEPLMHTSLAYLADAPRAVLAAAVFACTLVWASAALVGWLQARLECATAKRATTDSDHGAGHRHARDAASATPLRIAMAGIAWLVATALLSAPTVLYVVALYLPANNALHIGAAFTLILRRGVPFLLALINAVILPVLTRLLVKHGHLAHGSPARAATLSSRLLLLARLLTTIVIPVGAALVLGAECGGQWKALWSVCSGATNITVRYDAKTGCHPASGTGCSYYIPGALFAPPTLTAEQLCASSVGGGYGSGRCARGVIEDLAPLFAEKLAIAACLQPALLLLFFESGTAGRVSRGVFGRADGRYRVGLDMEFAAALAQIEMALFYGVALPVVLPIAAASLATHWLAFRWLLREGGIAVLPCASPPIGWLRISVALQAALATWFFGATHGAPYGWTVGTFAFVGAMCAGAAGARLSGWQRAREARGARLVSSERGLRLTTLRGADTEAHDTSTVGGADLM